ncbi:MAG: winged helix-turn-helix domain-containing protein [Spirochaetales bacterium]|nr:winged helix-turn-helix domain-containing protein [Spirochaetales bacterium]
MLQRIIALTALAIVLLISILFLFVFAGMHHSMADEQERTERYILSTMGNTVHAIRNEILFPFENYSDEIRKIDFPPVVRDIFFLDPKDGGNLKDNAHGGSMPFYREFLGYLNDITVNRNLSIINIYDLEGYKAFPINKGPDGNSVGFLVVSLDLRNVVGKYMPARLKMELEMSVNRNKRDTEQEYLILTKRGKDIVPSDRQFLIDLNRDFNLFNVQDYYYTRPDAFVPLMKNKMITANHSYLVIYHREAEPGAFMREKIRNYSILPGKAEEEGWLDLNQVRQYDEAVSTRTLYVHIAWLREKPGIRAEDIRL